MTNVTPKKIYETAKSWLGRDASPEDSAPDELGCAETVSNILFDAGCVIPIMLSTSQLRHYLETRGEWKRVQVPGPGDIIISPTGEGGSNGMKHGHTGIVMVSGMIASNDSHTGLFLENYSLSSWRARYEDIGDYPIYFYRIQGTSPEVSPEVAKTVSDGLSVAREALSHPELKSPALKLLGALATFVNSLNPLK